MSMINVNGKTYDWGDITVQLIPYSPVLVTCSAISFSESLDTKPIYGKGRSPVAYGKGNWEASGRLTLLKTEFDILQKAAGHAGILNLDPRVASIHIVFGPNLQGLVPVADVLLMGVRFTRISDSYSQSDNALKNDLEFLVLGNVYRDGIPARGRI